MLSSSFIKMVNLLKLSVAIIILFPCLLSSTPAEAIDSSSSPTIETLAVNPSCYRQLENINNGADSMCSPSVVHIAMTLEDHNFRGTVAAIHSILHHYACRENIFFHFILLDSNDNLEEAIKHVFPSLKFRAHYFSPEIVQNMMSPAHRIQEPLKYARNYLADILGPFLVRVIYLDSDVIFIDDISLLWRTNLASRTVGLPEDFSNNLAELFIPKFWSGNKFSDVFSGWNPCYFNTGGMVINLFEWRRLGYALKLERLMEIQKEHAIYELGPLSPLLAPIDRRWSMKWLAAGGTDGCGKLQRSGPISLLHLSGKWKPWERLDSGYPCPFDHLWSLYDMYRPYCHYL